MKPPIKICVSATAEHQMLKPLVLFCASREKLLLSFTKQRGHTLIPFPILHKQMQIGFPGTLSPVVQHSAFICRVRGVKSGSVWARHMQSTRKYPPERNSALDQNKWWHIIRKNEIELIFFFVFMNVSAWLTSVYLTCYPSTQEWTLDKTWIWMNYHQDYRINKHRYERQSIGHTYLMVS